MNTLKKKQVGEKLIVKGIQKDSIVKKEDY